jgi:hypothetical protein
MSTTTPGKNLFLKEKHYFNHNLLEWGFQKTVTCQHSRLFTSKGKPER